MSFVLFNLNMKRLTTKNTRRSILYRKHALIIFLKRRIFLIIGLPPGQCNSAITKFAMLMINKGIYNHPSKHFASERFKEVAARKGIHAATSA